MNPIPILTYHQIEKAPPKGTPMRSLYVSKNSFERQMMTLKVLGYKGLSMSELQPYLLGQKQGRVIGITFDDGYLNNLVHAAPILKSMNFSSTCYVVSDLIGGTNSWDHMLGVPSAPLMNLAQIKEWIDLGQEVGSHTRTHPHLIELEDSVAREEIELSKSELQSRLGVVVNQFCYPYGQFTKVHAELVKAAGYWAATTTKRGRVQALNGSAGNLVTDKDYLFELPRVPVVRSTYWPQFLLKIATSYETRRAVMD